jgi:glutathione peroxidase
MKNDEFYGIEATLMNGERIPMSFYEGKVILVVNTASKCGYTKQFGPLEKLYQDRKDEGLVILGFPCNQFAGQDPGSDDEILAFCQLNYGVTFPMFQKIKVKGKDIHPLYDYLVNNAPEDKGKKIGWNFEKFLIDREGKIIHRYNKKVIPEDVLPEIDKLL